MSIASELERILEAKAEIRIAINAKGGDLSESQLIDEYADAVNNIHIPEETDLSFITATADDILAGTTGADVNGNPVSGTIETVTAFETGDFVVVPQGYHSEEQSFKNRTDLSFVTATANMILEDGVGADLNGNPVYGTIPYVVARHSSGNSVYVPSGYHGEEKFISVGNPINATTYIPGTTDQTIPVGTYINGEQIIKGDSNLLPENIAEGVTIFGVTGTYTGESEPVIEITVTTPVTLTGTQNTAITDIQLAATVSDGGQATFTSSDLPTGLTLSNTGLISGTPTVSGTGSSSITVSYTGAESKTITLNWNLEAAVPSPTQKYVYTVSGAGTSEANGNYWSTDNLVNTYTSAMECTNGTCTLTVDDMGNKVLLDASDNVLYMGDTSYYYDEMTWYVENGEGNAPTITKYEGENSGWTYERDYRYSVSGSNSEWNVDGDYWLDPNLSYNNQPVYINNANYCMVYNANGDNRWSITSLGSDLVNAMLYKSPTGSITGAWVVQSVPEQPPTVTEYSADEPGTDDKTYVYTVSGDSYPEIAGNYYNTGRTGWEENLPIYSNDAGTYYITYFADYWRIVDANSFDSSAEDFAFMVIAETSDENTVFEDPSTYIWDDGLEVSTYSSETTPDGQYVKIKNINLVINDGVEIPSEDQSRLTSFAGTYEYLKKNVQELIPGVNVTAYVFKSNEGKYLIHDDMASYGSGNWWGLNSYSDGSWNPGQGPTNAIINNVIWSGGSLTSTKVTLFPLVGEQAGSGAWYAEADWEIDFDKSLT